jgi:hypothetical protein
VLRSGDTDAIEFGIGVIVESLDPEPLQLHAQEPRQGIDVLLEDRGFDRLASRKRESRV